MFRKREKKVFPPNTFIATPARVAAIMHLCLGLTLLLWTAAKPFMGDLFSIKSEMLLYQAVVEKPALLNELPKEQAEAIESNYQELKRKLQLPFGGKIKSVFVLLFSKTPPLKQMWLLFSLILPVMLLMRIEGAAQACCLLPLIVLAYAADNYYTAFPVKKSLDESLFPSEQQVVESYLSPPLSASILEQQIDLTKAWQRYLIDKWAHQPPSENPELFQKQLARGEFAFNVARIEKRKGTSLLAVDVQPEKESWPMLTIYFCWNFFFAACAVRYVLFKKDSKSSPICA